MRPLNRPVGRFFPSLFFISIIHATNMKKKKEIYEGALRLIVERGYDNTPLSLIAHELGLSKGGLFHYFHSKEQLLYEIINYFIRKDFFPIIEHAKKIKDPQERLTYFFKGYIELLTKGPVAIVAIHEVRRLSPEHYNEIRKIWNGVYEFVYGAIADMQSAGKAKRLNKAFSAFSLIGMCSWLFYWFDYSRKDSAEELFSTLNAIFFRAVLDRDNE